MDKALFPDESINDVQDNAIYIDNYSQNKGSETMDVENTTEMPSTSKVEEKEENTTNSNENTTNQRPNYLNINKKQFRQLTVIDSSPIIVSNEIPEELEVDEVVPKESNEYNMNHKYRGKLIIINQEYFEDRLKQECSDREGTSHDVESLKSVAKLLEFEVEIYNNLTLMEIMKMIEKVCEDDHRENDCLWLFVLSHGNKSGIAAADYFYQQDILWDKFTADKCISLAGKPKLIFIQACRGDKRDPGVKVAVRNMSITETDSAPQSYKMPTHADFLIAYSTAENFVSFRDPDKGTFYVQTLCEVLRENYKTTDILKMLTITSRKVALNFLSNSDVYDMNNQTQIPCFTSLLTRDVYFKPKQ